jgi:hypothetical protein
MMGRLWRSRQKDDVRLTNVVRQGDFESDIRKEHLSEAENCSAGGEVLFLGATK